MLAAELGYRKVLARSPRNADAWHFFGLLRHNQGNSEAAVDIIRRSLRLAPGNTHAWLNLGNVLLTLNRVAEAERAYRKVTRLDPSQADGWYNLGICLRRGGNIAPSAESLEHAVSLRPQHARSHYQLGLAQKEQGHLELAETSMRRALAIDPGLVFESLSVLLYRMSKFPEATEMYQQWLEHEPDNPIARHMAATGGGVIPDRAADQYVAEVFDRFAESFDSNLARLDYQAPQILAGLLSAELGDAPAPLRILDAGCGTGLCGSLLRPMASQLVGVDLSTAMVSKARERQLYDELVVAELCAFMSSREGAFNVIVAADTLVYFGVLGGALRSAHTALASGGMLAFTLECMRDEDTDPEYRLEPHGRYTHRAAYAEKLLTETGFALRTLERVVLRRERGADVAGLAIVARRG